MLSQWYVARGERHAGPFTIDQVRAMVLQGELKRDDLIWEEGSAGWTPAGLVNTIFPEPPPIPETKKATLSLFKVLVCRTWTFIAGAVQPRSWKGITTAAQYVLLYFIAVIATVVAMSLFFGLLMAGLAWAHGHSIRDAGFHGMKVGAAIGLAVGFFAGFSAVGEVTGK